MWQLFEISLPPLSTFNLSTSSENSTYLQNIPNHLLSIFHCYELNPNLPFLTSGLAAFSHAPIQFFLHTIRVIFIKYKSDHITVPLITLQRLPINLRIKSKFLTMAYKVLQEQSPISLSSLPFSLLHYNCTVHVSIHWTLSSSFPPYDLCTAFLCLE